MAMIVRMLKKNSVNTVSHNYHFYLNSVFYKNIFF